MSTLITSDHIVNYYKSVTVSTYSSAVAEASGTQKKIITVSSTGIKYFYDGVAGVITSLNNYQDETISFRTSVLSAGGYVDTLTLSAIDRFIVRGKLMGWWTTLKILWVPVGDFNASKIWLVYPSGITPSYNNFVTGDYSQGKGYSIPATNTTKWIDTNFIPSANGLSSTNVSMGICTLADISPSDNGYLLGSFPTNTALNPPLHLWPIQNSAGLISLACTWAFGGEAQVFTCRYGTTFSSYLNGAPGASNTNTSTDVLDSALTLYRTQRSGGTTQYSQGAIGAFYVGTDMTAAQNADLNLAITDLMIGVNRDVYKRQPMIAFGDSITEGYSGGLTLKFNQMRRWTKLLSKKLGLREQNNGVGGSRTTTNNANILSAINRYQSLANGLPGIVSILYGANDISEDPATSGTAGNASTYTTNLNTVVQGFLNSNHKVILGGPLWRGTSADATKLALYNNAAASVAKANKIPYADLYNMCLDLGYNSATYFGDNLHPGDTVSISIAEYMYEAHLGKLVRKPTLDFGSIASLASADLTVTVYGAVVGMPVSLTVPATFETGLVATAFVSATDTVTVRITNITAAAIDPASGRFNITVTTTY